MIRATTITIAMSFASIMTGVAAARRDVPAPTPEFAIVVEENGSTRNSQCSDYRQAPDGSWSTTRPVVFVIEQEPSGTGGEEAYVRFRAGRYRSNEVLKFAPAVLLNGTDVVEQLKRLCAPGK